MFNINVLFCNYLNKVLNNLILMLCHCLDESPELFCWILLLFYQLDTKSSDVKGGNVLNLDLNALDASHGSLGYTASVGSFPVDVVVLIKVESSVIRFNCVPISRVECLVQVPSLELVFSTKKSDVEGAIKESTPPTKSKSKSTLIQITLVKSFSYLMYRW